ncbi:isochorismatase family protein [Alsobacter sp. KACC 23698]|uniref:nicotinamidase n=1 Tax=Alsobacter sp. KACC 23698 TaxID=3149229 RepID=A0AAU7JFV5_9HYPH
MTATFTPKDALLLVDLQNDFCSGGALPVPDGDHVVPAANRWISRAVQGDATIVASADWHPAQHPSFVPNGGPWPVHCLAGSRGAAFHPTLRLPPGFVLVTKGTRLDRDQYSAFDETGLADWLGGRGVRRVWIGGLAEDICVRATALASAAAGFETHLLTECTRGLSPEGSAATRMEILDAGVFLTEV